jgi:hypothetical protein
MKVRFCIPKHYALKQRGKAWKKSSTHSIFRTRLSCEGSFRLQLLYIHKTTASSCWTENRVTLDMTAKWQICQHDPQSITLCHPSSHIFPLFNILPLSVSKPCPFFSQVFSALKITPQDLISHQYACNGRSTTVKYANNLYPKWHSSPVDVYSCFSF